MEFKYYKIKNKDGKYSTGGSSPRFTKNGKTWHQQGHVTNHVTQIVNPNTYYGCYLVIITPEGVEEKRIEPFLLEKYQNYYNKHITTSACFAQNNGDRYRKWIDELYQIVNEKGLQ
jgi:hypothetical protein